MEEGKVRIKELKRRRRENGRRRRWERKRTREDGRGIHGGRKDKGQGKMEEA